MLLLQTTLSIEASSCCAANENSESKDYGQYILARQKYCKQVNTIFIA
jgi:hypothetical protein